MNLLGQPSRDLLTADAPPLTEAEIASIEAAVREARQRVALLVSRELGAEHVPGYIFDLRFR